MIKMLIMIECDECSSVFSEVISLTNSSVVPRNQLHKLLLNVEEEGWQSHNASTTQICYDCWHPEKAEQNADSEDSFCPF
jgi:hypothetical protein